MLYSTDSSTDLQIAFSACGGFGNAPFGDTGIKDAGLVFTGNSWDLYVCNSFPVQTPNKYVTITGQYVTSASDTI